MRKRKNDAWRETIYALYRGENNICDGTIEEISRKSGKSVKMLRWMLNPAYARRIRRPKKEREKAKLCTAHPAGWQGGRIMKEKSEEYLAGYEAGKREALKNLHLPHPCDGPRYACWGPGVYFDKILEEDEELVEAWDNYCKAKLSGGLLLEESEHLFRECADLITATTSFMWSMGLKTREERGQYIRLINESNRKRDNGRRWANPNDEA